MRIVLSTTNSVQCWPNSVQCWPNLIRCWPNLVQCWPNLVQCWPNLVQCWPNSTQCWTNLVQCWPNLVQCWPNLVQCWPNSIQCWPKYSKPNKQLFILSKCQPSLTGLQGTLPDSVSVVYFNADLRPFRENRNRAPCHTWQLKLIYFWELQLAYSRGSFQ